MKEFISSLKTISTTMILKVDDSIIYKEEMYMSRKQIVYFMGKYISMDPEHKNIPLLRDITRW